MGKRPIRVDLARSACQDLEDIARWYEDQGVPQVGIALVAELFLQIERLRNHPDSGRVVPEFGMAVLREIIHPPFRIVYRRGVGRIWVVRIWRSERRMNPSLG